MIEKTYIKWCSYAWTPCDLGVIPGEEINKIRYKITCAALPRPWGLSSSLLLLSEEGLTDSLIPHGVTQFFKRLLYQTYHNCSCRPSYRHHLDNNPYGLLLAWTVSLHSERLMSQRCPKHWGVSYGGYARATKVVFSRVCRFLARKCFVCSCQAPAQSELWSGSTGGKVLEIDESES